MGPVPALARAAGALGVAGALALIVGGALPYADVGGRAVSAAPPAWLASGLWPLALLAGGVSVLAGRLPRLGLATIGVSGALAAASAVVEAYQLVDAGSHRAVEVALGQRLVVSDLAPGPGVWLTLTAYCLLVLALAATLVAWPCTTMEDSGTFDVLRPRALVASAVAAVAGALAVVAPVHTAPDEVVEDVTGLQRTLEVPADVALPERLGLDLLGGGLLAAAVVVTALLVATLRPRLASVGGYAGLAAYFLSAGLVALAEAGRYADLLVGPGGWLLLVAGVLFTALAGWALRAGSDEIWAPGSSPTVTRGTQPYNVR